MKKRSSVDFALIRTDSSVASNASHLYMLGITAATRGDFNVAASYVGRASNLVPESAEYRTRLGTILAAAGRYHDAITAQYSAIRIQPSLPEAWNNLGVALCSSGRCEDGIRAFETAIAQREDYTLAYTNLADTFERLAMPRRAIRYWKRASEVSDNPEFESKSLLCLQYILGNSPEILLKEHMAWAKRSACDERQCDQHFPNLRDPARRLRIGPGKRVGREKGSGTEK